MFTRTLRGLLYDVHYRMEVVRETKHSRGDHGMGGGEYEISYGIGEVTVRNRLGQAVAVCKLKYEARDKHGQYQEVSDSAFKRCLEATGLLPGQEERFVEYLAQKWITLFRTPGEGGIPTGLLEKPDRTKLIEQGIVLDPNGQASFPFQIAVGT